MQGKNGLAMISSQPLHHVSSSLMTAVRPLFRCATPLLMLLFATSPLACTRDGDAPPAKANGSPPPATVSVTPAAVPSSAASTPDQASATASAPATPSAQAAAAGPPP